MKTFGFGLTNYHLYDPKSVYNQHYAKIHFNLPSRNYSRPKEEKIKNCYNASRPHTLVNHVGPSHVNPEQEATSEARPLEKCHPMRIKYKSKVAHSLPEEKSHKYKVDPTILKATMVAKIKRKQKR